jgi:hypothetical protein
MISNKKLGNGFESVFETITSKKWTVTRIPDGCKQLGLNKIIRKKSPFDFLLTGSAARSFYCDAKTTQADRFSYSTINQDQVTELLRIEKNGHVAGYVIEFRQVGKICFASASLLAALAPRESLKAWDCVDLGLDIDLDKLFKKES